MATPEDLYTIYTVTFGKVSSGTKLTGADYVRHEADGFSKTPYTEEERLAVTIASDDVHKKAPMKSKSEFLSALANLRK